VNRRARKWAAAAALLALVAGGALAFGQLSGTFAIFTADTENPNSAFTAGWIPPPSTPSSSNNGSPYATEHLAWTSGNSTVMPSGSNPVTGQALLYADGGASTTGSAGCPSAGSGSYSAFSTPAANATTADVTGNNVSQWWCFEVQSTSGGPWTSDFVTFPGRRIFAATSVALNNKAGQTLGTMENGDTIVITYNQNLSFSGGITVISCTAGNILIGASACGTTPTIGTITGVGVAHSRPFNGPSTTAGNGTTTLTITLAGSAATTTITGTGTFTPGTGVTSSGAQNICTTCTVSASGDF
jgi:hypothetical protein